MTVNATVTAAPITGNSRNVPVTYPAAQALTHSRCPHGGKHIAQLPLVVQQRV